MLINDGENGPEIVCAANAKDQAMLLFTEAANMRQQSAALRMVEKKRRTDIYSEFNFGTLKALSSNHKRTVAVACFLCTPRQNNFSFRGLA